MDIIVYGSYDHLGMVNNVGCGKPKEKEKEKVTFPPVNSPSPLHRSLKSSISPGLSHIF